MAGVREEGRNVAGRFVRSLVALVLALGVLVSTTPSAVVAAKGAEANGHATVSAFVPAEHDKHRVVEPHDPDGHCPISSCDLKGLNAEPVTPTTPAVVPLHWVPIGERGRSMRPLTEPDPPRSI